MFSDRDRSIVQRGIDEAMACRDMLAPAPVRSSPFARALARTGAALRALHAAMARGLADRRPARGSATETIR